MRIKLILVLILAATCLSATAPAAANTIADKNTKTNYVQGKQYYHKKDYDMARYFLLRALRDDPSDQQSLQLLVNIEERTKHYATAIVHVNELLALNPYNEGLWQKKIHLYRLQKNDVEADRLLERLATIYPENTDIQRQLRGRTEEIYLRQRTEGDVAGQIASLRQMITTPDGATTENILSLSNLLAAQGHTSESLDVIDMGLTREPRNATLVRKKVGILSEQGRLSEAYAFVKMHGNDAKMLRELEEAMIAQSQINDPYTIYGRIWQERHTEEALQYLITTSITRGYLDDAQYYLREARKRHGDTPELLAKSYNVELRLGNEAQAFQLAQLLHKADPTNQEYSDIIAAKTMTQANEYFTDMRYTNALALYDSIIALNPDSEIVATALYRKQAIAKIYAEKKYKDQLVEWEKQLPLLIKAHESEQAIAVADSLLQALDQDDKNNKYTISLTNYYKGLALEQLHKWQESYECLRLYEPTAMEVADHKRHLDYLLSKLLRNDVSIEYQQMRLGSEDKITANATATYTHLKKNLDSYSAFMQYTGRDYEVNEALNAADGKPIYTDDGGTGIMLGATYRHRKSEKLTYEGTAAFATKYFPYLTLKAAATWTLPKDRTIEPHIAYRKTSESHIITLGATGTQDIDQFHLSATADLLYVSGLHFNISAKAQYFPLEHSKTHVFATCGAGNAPEISIIDHDLPFGFKKLNTFVGAGGFYSFNRNLGGALSGSWYNLFNKSNKFKNYFYINASLQVSF